MTSPFDEVLRFAEHGPLLQPSGPIVGAHIRVVDNLEQAEEYAYRTYLTDAEDAFNWLDLRANQRSQGSSLSDEELGRLQLQRREVTERLFDLVQPRLPPVYANLVDDIVGDLGNCAYFRAVFGDGDRLFDLIWSAYRQGGWPCGWIGDYPAGQLVVFRP